MWLLLAFMLLIAASWGLLAITDRLFWPPGHKDCRVVVLVMDPPTYTPSVEPEIETKDIHEHCEG